jgi:hypothetical protein
VTFVDVQAVLLCGSGRRSLGVLSADRLRGACPAGSVGGAQRSARDNFTTGRQDERRLISWRDPHAMPYFSCAEFSDGG